METAFLADLCKICFFSLHPKEIFPIFAPAIPGEIGTARESAFFALFLDSEPRQFICEIRKRIEGKKVAFAVMSVFQSTTYTAERTLIHCFFSYGKSRPNCQK